LPAAEAAQSAVAKIRQRAACGPFCATLQGIPEAAARRNAGDRARGFRQRRREVG
jgi:hypothetical protein